MAFGLYAAIPDAKSMLLSARVNTNRQVQELWLSKSDWSHGMHTDGLALLVKTGRAVQLI